jgi:tRNA (guanine26-N2/guanine27-N2)-dimethyltransferase
MRATIEGRARISASGGVFYNPKMAKLRDISVLFVKAAVEGNAKLLDCTAASGVRGIRYALEAGVKDATLIDINADAARAARANAKANGLKLRVLNESIQEFANTRGDEAFDVIDLDPFGTPVPYVNDLLKLSKDGTLFMITATDTATLCGAEEKACVKLYGSRPSHNELCHEAGVRILLNYVAREAAQFNFGIEPALSIADMHYMRVFVFLRRSAEKAFRSVSSSGFGASCPNCHNFSIARGIVPQVETKCGNCGKKMNAFGPLWLGGLHDKEIVSKMLKLGKGYSPEAVRLLENVNGELDVPFFYDLSKITEHLRMSSVPMGRVVDDLAKRHSVSRTHFSPNCIKTDAGVGEIIASAKKASRAKA